MNIIHSESANRFHLLKKFLRGMSRLLLLLLGVIQYQAYNLKPQLQLSPFFFSLFKEFFFINKREGRI